MLGSTSSSIRDTWQQNGSIIEHLVQINLIWALEPQFGHTTPRVAVEQRQPSAVVRRDGHILPELLVVVVHRQVVLNHVGTLNLSNLLNSPFPVPTCSVCAVIKKQESAILEIFFRGTVSVERHSITFWSKLRTSAIPTFDLLHFIINCIAFFIAITLLFMLINQFYTL
jgi:hypothetical protein